MSAQRYNTLDFNSRRSPVFARRGLIATSHPLASATGLAVLQRGGNAVDAAVAAAAVLGVTSPYQTGLGGDCFALIYLPKDKRVRALNASGPAPAAATLELYRGRGLAAVPKFDPLAWTVPGCVDGWAQMLAAHGTLRLADVLDAAIGYAAEGYPVSPCDARNWALSDDLLRRDPEAARTLLPQGRPPHAGEVLVQPDLARSLRIVAEGGRDAFYEGEIAERLVAYATSRGGLLERRDLAAYRAEWVEPIACDYRGRRIVQCPPNGQGLAALIALRALEGVDLSRFERHSADCWHLMIEAMKQGMVDAAAYVADPRFHNVQIGDLLAAVPPPQGRTACEPQARALGWSNTVYLAVVDRDGLAVSFINSIYDDFGSGHVAEGLGFCMQNRGAGFSLDPAHPNRLEPGKRPFHTIIPGMMLDGDELSAVFGVTGGFMQPQGHVQLAVNLVDYGMDVQSAIDAPRFWWEQGRRVVIEQGAPDDTVAALAAWGHDIVRREHRSMGGAQAILMLPDGVRVAGSEPRQDGCAIGW